MGMTGGLANSRQILKNCLLDCLELLTDRCMSSECVFLTAFGDISTAGGLRGLSDVRELC